jgi:hypothetical protein
VTEPAVSIIVVNYNGARWLDACLGRLVAGLPRDAEVILVDNGSADDSVAMVRERFPAVRVVQLGRNHGFAGGNNRGADVARGRYLAFLNNDTEAQPGWCDHLRRALETDPGVALATARIVFLDDPLTIDSAGDGITRVGGAFKRGHGEPAPRWEVPGEVFGACGAACMIRRDVFAAVGGFDEDFFLVFEDVDLSWRVRLLGYRCAYVPAAEVRHAVSASLGSASDVAVYYGQRNLEWCFFKNMPLALLVLTAPGHLLYVLAGAVYYARLGRLGAFIRGKSAALGGLWRMAAKRRDVQSTRVLSAGRLWKLMTPGWISLKLREKGVHRPGG